MIPDLLNGAFKLCRRFSRGATFVFLDLTTLCLIFTPLEPHNHRPEVRVGEW